MAFRAPLESLIDGIPDDHADQTTAQDLARRFVPELPSYASVLDLGCGAGDSKDFFQHLDSTLSWLGLDIEDSPEVRTRTKDGDDFLTYDGTHIPLESDSLDLVYSIQVFEHVRHPETVLKEVLRILKPGGLLLGSTSNLEPYHSFSYWNFTPFGFAQIAQDAGLEVFELRPGIDGPTLIWRQVTGRKIFLNSWWSRSPLNGILEAIGQILEWSPRTRNAMKLHWCGQFCFAARKPGIT